MQQLHDATQASSGILKVVTPTDRQATASEAGRKRILVALSGSEPSAATVDVVADLAQRLPADVIAYHVREWLVGLPGEWILGDEEPFDEGEEVASRVLGAMVEPLLAKQIQSKGIPRWWGGRDR